MPRKPVPEIEKIKDRIIALPEGEQKAAHEWLSMVIAVREQDRRAAEKRAAKTKENANGNG